MWNLIYRPTIPNNITNLEVFDDDAHILNFLHMKGIFKDSIIYEETHDQLVQKVSSSVEKIFGKLIQKLVARMETFYDLWDKFTNVINYKTNTPTM